MQSVIVLLILCLSGALGIAGIVALFVATTFLIYRHSSNLTLQIWQMCLRVLAR